MADIITASTDCSDMYGACLGIDTVTAARSVNNDYYEPSIWNDCVSI